MIRRLNIVYEIDWVLVIMYLFLVVFGWLNVFAVGYDEEFKSIFDRNTNYGNQLRWLIFTAIFIFLLFLIDHKFFHYFAYVIYGFSVFLLLFVLVFGYEINSAKSWIKISSFTFQPSEFLKIGVALALSRYLSGYNIKRVDFKSSIISLIIVFAPVMFILLQPDWGTAMVFCAFIVVLFREGLPGWILILIVITGLLFIFSLILPMHIIMLISLGIILTAHQVIYKNVKVFISALLIFCGIYAIIYTVYKYQFNSIHVNSLTLISIVISTVVFIILSIILKIRYIMLLLPFLIFLISIPYSVDFIFQKLEPHQQNRVEVTLGLKEDTKKIGYNVDQSKIAIGSGRISGTGFLKGTQTKLDYVPEVSTDFIFCNVGEEWGFIGTSLVVLLFTALFARIIFIAERQRLKFARIYGYCVVSVLFFHFAINVSMTLDLFPVIGIPLPFFSKGGSSLFAFSILLFILIRLDAARKTYLR